MNGDEPARTDATQWLFVVSVCTHGDTKREHPCASRPPRALRPRAGRPIICSVCLKKQLQSAASVSLKKSQSSARTVQPQWRALENFGLLAQLAWAPGPDATASCSVSLGSGRAQYIRRTGRAFVGTDSYFFLRTQVAHTQQ
jgi:hypothetical protein